MPNPVPSPASPGRDAAGVILEDLPDGIALVREDDSIVWCNGRLARWSGKPDLRSRNFFEALDHPETLGPDASPFRTAIATGRTTTLTLRTADNRYFHVQSVASTAFGADPVAVASVRDVTHTILEQQKLAAIHQAGQTLADLTPAELADMTVEERIELLKSNILHYSKDLLQFDVVEIGRAHV